MRIRDLNNSEALRQFRSGLSWRVGVFSVRLATRDAFVADQLRLLYGEYPLVPESRLIDAHVASVRSGWLRARFSIFRDGRRAYRRVPPSRWCRCWNGL